MLTLDVKLIVIAAGSINGWPTVEERIAESLKRNPHILCVLVDADEPRAPKASVTREDGEAAQRLVHLDRADGGWTWRAAVPTEPIEFVTPRDAITSLQLRNGIERHETVAVGATVADVDLAEAAIVYVHVGPEEALRRRHRFLVPLWDQWAAGVANVIDYFDERGWSDAVIQYSDMVDFVRNARRFYERPDAPTVVRQWHKRFCDEMIERFEEGIAGIFGTGFPFYCSAAQPTTPSSIIAYLSEQERYFSAKVVDSAFLGREGERQLSREDAVRDFGLETGTNRYDDYEYTSRGREPIASDGDTRSVSEWHDAAALAVGSDPWPCQHCVSWQAPDLRPIQRVHKDTNVVCLRCRQTPFMLRNIMTSCVDLDVIVVVEDSSGVDADAIKRYVLKESTSYLYDLDLCRTVFGDGDGPVDLFVANKSDVVAALRRIAGPEWLSVGFPATALWSLPLADHFFNLGEDFALTWVEHSRLDPQLERELWLARAEFARGHDPDSVIAALREHSLGHQEIVGNPGVAQGVRDRVTGWLKTPVTDRSE